MDTISPEVIHLASEKQTGRKVVMESQALERAAWLRSGSGGKSMVTPKHSSPQTMGEAHWYQARTLRFSHHWTLSKILHLSLDTPWKSTAMEWSGRHPSILCSMTHCTWVWIGLFENFSQWSCLYKHVKEDIESWVEGLGEFTTAEKLKHLR